MSVTAVTDHIDKDIAVEFLPVTCGDLRNLHHGFGIISIDAECGALHHETTEVQ